MSDRAAWPLGRIVALRIVLFAVIAMVAQLVAVVWEYGSDPDNLGRLMLEQETDLVAQGLTLRETRLGFELPPELASRYDTPGSGYIARVRTEVGTVLFSHCDAACADHFLPLDVNPPSFWLRRMHEGYPLSIAGGRTVNVGDRTAFVEIAIDRDPDRAAWGVLGSEVLEHMVAPMTLTLVFVLGASIFSIRSALLPVKTAAKTADALDPLRPDVRLETAGMPREVAQLASAVNRSFGRVGELMDAQKLFTSAIAHEVRTPLSVIRLQLERIDHPRANIALEELDALAAFVGQLTALARLEAADRRGFEDIRLDDMLRDVVASVAPWVYDRGATIAVEAEGGATILGQSALLRDAVRNLIENAVRHGGLGVAIVVAAGDGPSVTVSDDGPGMPEPASADAPGRYKRAGGFGIGLEIVRRIATLHGAAFDIVTRPEGGVEASLDFGGVTPEIWRRAKESNP